MTLAKLLFGFNGRINRSQFWLGNALASVGGIALVYAVGYGFGAFKATLALSWLSLPFILVAMTWSGFALQVKRFHDRGRSGLWVLAPLVPLSMIVVAVLAGIAEHVKPTQTLPELTLWFGALTLINLWFFVDLGLLASVDGPNKYGPPPGSRPGPAPPSTPGREQDVMLKNAARALERAIDDQARATAAPPLAFASAPLASTLAPAGFGRKPAQPR